MDGQRKYIRTKSGFVIWNDMTPVFHAHMAKLVDEPVISAGFCIFDGENFICWGRSDSLGINSMLGDSAAMDEFFGISYTN